MIRSGDIVACEPAPRGGRCRLSSGMLWRKPSRLLSRLPMEACCAWSRRIKRICCKAPNGAYSWEIVRFRAQTSRSMGCRTGARADGSYRNP